MRIFPVIGALLIAAGCSSPATRIEENPSLVAGLDAGTQARLRRGEIAIGDTEAAVQVAMGRPLRTRDLLEGGREWLYRDRPRDPNDYVASGFRHHVEFDPVKRTNVTTIQPVPDWMYPELRSHIIRVNFFHGRVTAVTPEEEP